MDTDKETIVEAIKLYLSNIQDMYDSIAKSTEHLTLFNCDFIHTLNEVVSYIGTESYMNLIEFDREEVLALEQDLEALLMQLINIMEGMLQSNTAPPYIYVLQQDFSEKYDRAWLPNTEAKSNTEDSLEKYSMAEVGCAVSAILNVVMMYENDDSTTNIKKYIDTALVSKNFSTEGDIYWDAFLKSLNIDLVCHRTTDKTLPNSFTYNDLVNLVNNEKGYVIMNVPYKTAGEPGHFLTLVDIEGVDGKATFTFMPSSTGDINLTSSRRSFGWKVEESTNLIKIPVSSLGGKFENCKEHLRVFAPKGYDFTLLDTKGLGTYFDLEHNKDKDSYTLLCNQENKSQFGNTAGVFIDYDNMSPNKVAVVARNPKDSSALTFTDYASMMAFVEGDYDELLSTPSAKDYEIGNWTYLGNGVFRAKEGATFEQLEESSQLKNIKQDLLFIKNKDWRTSSIDTLISSGDEVYFNFSAKELATLDAITLTDVVESDTWEYLGNGQFKAKGNARLYQLNDFLKEGYTWQDSDYAKKPEELDVGNIVSFQFGIIKGEQSSKINIKNLYRELESCISEQFNNVMKLKNIGYYEAKDATRIVMDNNGLIQELAQRYKIPASYIQSILFRELNCIDFRDSVADTLVAGTYNHKKQVEDWNNLTPIQKAIIPYPIWIFDNEDSSTGYAQIFAKTAIDAINFAIKKQLIDYKDLNLDVTESLSVNNTVHLEYVWRKLKNDTSFNIEMATINLLSCAYEKNNSFNFETFTPDQIKRVFTRYNHSTSDINEYGENCYEYYVIFEKYKELL